MKLISWYHTYRAAYRYKETSIRILQSEISHRNLTQHGIMMWWCGQALISPRFLCGRIHTSLFTRRNASAPLRLSYTHIAAISVYYEKSFDSSVDNISFLEMSSVTAFPIITELYGIDTIVQLKKYCDERKSEIAETKLAVQLCPTNQLTIFFAILRLHP